METKIRFKRFINMISESFIGPAFGLIAGILFVSILFLAWGSNPIDGFLGLWSGAFGSGIAIQNTIVKAVPLIICGIAVVISYKSGIFNIGAESQLYFGAIGATTIFVIFPNINPIIGIILAFLLGGLLGGILGAIPGYLKAFKGTNEIVVTMLLNYIAVLFLSMLVKAGPGGFLHNNNSQVGNQSVEVPKFMQLAHIWGAVHIGIIIAILIAVGAFIFLKYNSVGFKMRAVGQNPKAGEYAGINYKILQGNVMVVSGTIAGLAGVIEVLGTQHHLIENFTVGIGYTAIAVALLANLNSIGVIFSALFFSMLQTGGSAMQIRTNVPSSFGMIFQGVILFFVITGAVVPRIYIRIKEKRRLNKNA